MSSRESVAGCNNSAPHRIGSPNHYVGPNRSKFGADFFKHQQTGLRVEIVESSSRNPADRDQSTWTVQVRADGEVARKVHQNYVSQRSEALKIAAEWMEDNPEGQLPETWYDFWGSEESEEGSR